MRVAILLFMLTGLVLGAEAEFFETKIRPVLASQCYSCHSGQIKQPMGGIRLDTAEGVQLVVQSGKLLRSLEHQSAVKMPPSGKLGAAVIADFRRWVADGGEFAEAKGSGSFWAFEPLRPGAIELAAPRGAKSLDKMLLLRRVTFDLTGLPPTPAELKAFLEDRESGSYERVVNRLLGSPHYGERWARHWMDLVRYAETNGHEYDNDKLAPWRYRDYLIRAFNQDLPFDQFLKEHIAGDLLKEPRLSGDGATVESPLATAFYFFGEVLNSSTDPVKTKADVVDNQIDVLGKAFTGLTIACARCHDHKFDPIPTKEYYGVAGILHSTEYREVIIDSAARRAEVNRARQGGVLVPSASKVSYREGETVVAAFDRFGEWRNEGAAFGDGPIDGTATSLAAGAPEFVGTLTSPSIDMSDQRYLHVRLSGTKMEGRITENTPLRVTLVCGGYKARHIVADGPAPKWKTLSLVLERNRRCYVEIVDHSRDGWVAVDEILFSDHETAPAVSGGVVRQGPLLSVNVPPSEFAMVAGEGEGRDVHVHVKGNHLQLGELAPRQYLSVLAGKKQAPVSGSGRLELAERMVTPLSARVMVNRIWKHHFGEGLVKTTDNFGVLGERPAAQGLLDALAKEFIDSGYRIKSMQRRLVMSELYQSDALKPRRLEAEAVRDALLMASGRLDRTLFGPSVPPHVSPFQNGRGRPVSGPIDGNGRRSVYIQIRRNFVPPLFIAFDYPTPASTTGVRGESAVPSQALMLLNNEFVHQQARVLSEAVAGSFRGVAERVEEMYLRMFSRKPEAAEIARIQKFIEAQGGRADVDVYADVAHVLINSPEFIYVR